MFMGEYQHTIDDKGRLIIPAKFRQELGERFIMTKGLDNCLFVYPLEEWKRLEQKRKLSPLPRLTHGLLSVSFPGAVECDF